MTWVPRPLAGSHRARAGRHLRALLAMTHPLPSVGTALAAVGSAVLLAHGAPPAGPVIWLFLMVVTQQAAISVHNDWCDRDLDALAKPARALPSGLASAADVRIAAYALALFSFVPASPLGAAAAALNVAGLSAGFAYNARLKRSPLSWLPFLVAFPLVPMFAMAALDRWPPGWPLLFAAGAPAIAAIHFADAYADYEADERAGVRGVVQYLGRTASRRVMLGLLAVAGLVCLGHGIAAGWMVGTVSGLVALGLCGVAAQVPAHARLAVTLGAAVAALSWVAAVTAEAPATGEPGATGTTVVR